jgi:hypothetical protein
MRAKHGVAGLGLVVALTAVGVSTAAAAPGVIVVGGSAPEAQRAKVAAALEQRINDAGWTMPLSPPTKIEANVLLRCSDTTSPWNCVPPSFADQSIFQVLVVSVDANAGDDGSPVLVLVGKLIATRPEAGLVRQRFCEHCTDDRLVTASTELATQLLQELAVRDGRTAISVRSEPPGAEVTLDGARIGATNGTYNTFPGTHVVVIAKPGYATETRTVTADDGASSEVAVTLHRTGTTANPANDARPSHLGPALVIGAGVAALATGIALQATHDGPPLGEPQPARLYSGAGIGLIVAGAGLTGLGVYLWHRTTERSARSASPTVTVIDGGGLIGWTRTY